MKVLKHGNTIKTMICGECKCEFEYRRVDIENRPYVYLGQKYIKRIIKCPECGQEYIEK